MGCQAWFLCQGLVLVDLFVTLQYVDRFNQTNLPVLVRVILQGEVAAGSKAHEWCGCTGKCRKSGQTRRSGCHRAGVYR